MVVDKLLQVVVSVLLLLTVSGDGEVKRRFSLGRFVQDSGYPFEAHENIKTEDGYLLDILRIPNAHNNVNNCRRPPVLLVHGIGASAANWLVLGPHKAIGFALADKGDDVWIASVRGTRYSRKHTQLDPEKNSEYWDFSFHEIGVYDLPAIIFHVLRSTGHSQLILIGHSQGSTAYFVMSSIRPEMNQYVKMHIALAPAVLLGFQNNFIPRAEMSNFFGMLEDTRKKMKINEFSIRAGKSFCSFPFLNKGKVCNDVTIALFGIPVGIDANKIDPDFLFRIQNIYPETASVKQYLHYMQLMVTGEFKEYDYGTKNNIEKYGHYKPPHYNLTRAVAPTAIIYSQTDVFVPPHRIDELSHILPNVILKYRIPAPYFGHTDFIFIEEYLPYVLKQIFNLLAQFECKV